MILYLINQRKKKRVKETIQKGLSLENTRIPAVKVLISKNYYNSQIEIYNKKYPKRKNKARIIF